MDSLLTLRTSIRFAGGVAGAVFVGPVEDHRQHAAAVSAAADANRANGNGPASWEAYRSSQWEQECRGRSEQRRERDTRQAAGVATATANATAAYYPTEPVA